jgi:DNA repair protein RecO (recombination protein O)
MQQLITDGIILARTDYGEADKIITMLTPDHGKLRLIAKGVRRIKSKLAGGVELFSISRVTYIKGRSDIGTLVSARLEEHFGNIVKDIDRTMLGYDLIKQLDRNTEDQPEADYFTLMQHVFTALNTSEIPLEVIRLWFYMQLLRLSGHSPNLHTDTAGIKLAADQAYEFDFDTMGFYVREGGAITADHIKFLRLGFSDISAQLLAKVANAPALAAAVQPIVQTVSQTYLREPSQKFVS